MPVLELTAAVAAPREVVFDLARSVDLHTQSLGHTGERAVAGRTTGLMELGEFVTWEAKHFGVKQRLTSRITAFERPRFFRDSMTAGAFRRFDHDHLFEVDPADAGRTLMRDRFDWTSPLGPLGRLADRLFLRAYLTRLLETRNAAIRSAAESGDVAWFRPAAGVVG